MEDSGWKASQILRLLKRNNLRPESIVEIGCGAGEILNQLYMEMPAETNFAGYEVSPDAYRLCLQRKKERLDFFHENLLVKDVRYDLLLMMDVFEHVDDYIGFIKTSSGKATYKIYHIPLDISVSSVLRNVLTRVRNEVGHLHYFTKDTAIATIEYTGQQIIDHFYTAGAIELNNRSHTWKTRMLNLPRKLLFKLSPDMAVKLFGGYSLLVLAK